MLRSSPSPCHGKQWFLSVKPARLLFLCCAVFSSVLFCCFSFWLLRTNQTASASRFQVAGLVEADKALAFTALDGSLLGNRIENSISAGTDLRALANSSAEALGSGKDDILTDRQVVEIAPYASEVLDSVESRKDTVFDRTDAVGTNDAFQASPNLSGEGERNQPADASPRTNSGFSEELHRPVLFEDREDAALSLEKVVGDNKSSYSSCDVSNGRWVFDESHPLYTSNSCPFIDEGFSCEANGRMDKDYMKWRWKPHECDIPRFDPVKMLELIRGKRLVFVGDSINRNQWESLLCLLKSVVSDPNRVHEARGRKITKNRGNYNFKFLDYHCSVEFYVSHYLVQESKARVGQRRVNTLRIDTLDKSYSRWRGADVLVFNTAHWWSHHKTKAGVNYYQEGNQVHPRLDVSTAFRKALTTWASWVDHHVDPHKTQVFFRSSAPSHFSGGEWNSGGHCKESTRPLDDSFFRQLPEKNIILEEVVKQMRTPVIILNITNLSGLRIDGHPSIYGRQPGRGPPSNIQDCSHWCLPGIPDTWNELLYSHLLSRQRTASEK